MDYHAVVPVNSLWFSERASHSVVPVKAQADYHKQRADGNRYRQHPDDRRLDEF
jgi:hypothetical protein